MAKFKKIIKNILLNNSDNFWNERQLLKIQGYIREIVKATKSNFYMLPKIGDDMKQTNIIKYQPYHESRKEVYVIENLKGKHREHCLCWKCSRFTPLNRELNCKIANKLYALNVEFNVTTPVWECELFEEMKLRYSLEPQ